MKSKIIAALLVAAAAQCFTITVAAQDASAAAVAKIWIIAPKQGQAQQFEAAFGKHVEWRRKNNDPWHWEVYVQVDGADVGTYYARSGGHQWSDFDAYGEFEQKATDHWNSTVAQYVADVRSGISEEMGQISNWPQDAPDYQLFMIYSYDIKQGHATRFESSAKAIVDVLKQASWPYHWAFAERVSGGAVPGAVLVLPSRTWADMAEPDPNAFEVVAGKVGEEKAAAMFAEYTGALETTQAYVLQWLPQLTVEGAR